jgi:antirestriction protein ArdC
MTKNKATELIENALDSLVESLEKGQSAVLKSYLETMSRFHNYSLRNIMLIAMQRPNATHIAGFHAWRKLGRYVQKGEKGIAIVAPMVYKNEAAVDESDEASVSTINGYKVVHVFDVSQTDGQELPTPSCVQGDPNKYVAKLEKLIADKGIALEYSSIISADGYSTGGKIVIRKGLTPAEDFSVKAHELAHEFLHHSGVKLSKTQKETEAEAVAFVVSSAIGLDPNTAFSDYIQTFHGDKETLMGSIQRVKDTSGRIIKGLNC